MALHLDDLGSECRTDKQILEDKIVVANIGLEKALSVLDHLLQESTCFAYGFAREPRHPQRCAENGKALDVAHTDIAKCKKDLFQFKLKHGE